MGAPSESIDKKAIVKQNYLKVVGSEYYASVYYSRINCKVTPIALPDFLSFLRPLPVCVFLLVHFSVRLDWLGLKFKGEKKPIISVCFPLLSNVGQLDIGVGQLSQIRMRRLAEMCVVFHQNSFKLLVLNVM